MKNNHKSIFCTIFLNSFSVYQEILRIKNNQLKYLNSFFVYQVILRIKKKIN